jgi:hypothetical protein
MKHVQEKGQRFRIPTSLKPNKIYTAKNFYSSSGKSYNSFIECWDNEPDSHKGVGVIVGIEETGGAVAFNRTQLIEN